MPVRTLAIFACFILFLVLIGGVFVRSTQAANITVNVAYDSLANPDSNPAVQNSNDCSLREAIQNANDDAATYNDCPAGSGADVISFTVGTITFDAEIFIVSDIQMNGAVTFDGGNSNRMFVLASPGNGVLRIDEVTFQNGEDQSGGAILMQGGGLICTESRFENNFAIANGGAIYGNGPLDLNGCFFENNQAVTDGGAIYHFGADPGSIIGTVFRDNSAGNDGPGSGGAIYATSALTITGSAFDGNVTNTGEDTGKGGGAIFNGSELVSGMVITASAFGGNRVDGTDGNGGAIFNNGLSALSINYSHFGTSPLPLPAPFDTITEPNSVTGENSRGGAVFVFGATNILGSSFIGNTSANDGGAFAYGSLSDNITIANSTFSGNSATNDGGAIYNPNDDALLTLTNVTITDNTAGRGGGIYNDGDGDNVDTLNDEILLQNSIISGNGGSPANCGGGTLSAEGTNNVLPVGECANAGGVTGDPQLGSLELTFSVLNIITWVHPLGSSSAALGTGDPSVCSAFPVLNLDQRAFPRPQGDANCDAGAYESDAISATDTPTATATPTASETPTATATASETMTPTATATASETMTPTATATASETMTPTATATASETTTATATATASETTTATATATASETTTATATATATASETTTATATATATATETATSTSTPVPLCTLPVDIMFVTDRSYDISSTEFDAVKNFMTEITWAYDVSTSGTNIGITTFSSSVTANISDPSGDATSIRSTISGLTKSSINGRADLGVTTGYNNLLANGRSTGVMQVMIWIVADDGTAMHNNTIRTIATNARNAGMYIITLGVSMDSSSDDLYLEPGVSNSYFGVMSSDILNYVDDVVAVACGGDITPPTATATATASETATTTATATATATASDTPDPNATATATATATETPTQTNTPDPNATSTPTATATLTPPPGSTGGTAVPAAVFLCDNLAAQSNQAMFTSGGAGNVVRNGVYGNVFCRIIVKDSQVITSLAEIGVLPVIQAGVIQAVDMFGLLPDGTPVVPFIRPMTVCLRGSGTAIFLSAENSLRTPLLVPILPNSPAGYSCGSIPVSGTITLVRDSTSAAPIASTLDPSSGSVPLTNCQVRTLNPLNLRSTPSTVDSSNIIEVLPYQTVLTATERIPGWYGVLRNGVLGWVTAEFVETIGDC